MATNPAPTVQDTTPPQRVPLWSAPVFVLGVGALVAVCLCRPLFPDHPAALHRDLAAASALLARPDGDPEEAIKLTKRALASIDLDPRRAGEAALLLAEAHIRLAEGAGPDRAAEYWQQAAHHLAQVDQSSLSNEQRMALLFRQAKVGFHINENPREVITRLEQCADQIEKRAEAFDLLTRTYLLLPTPDLQKALEANNRLRDVPELTAEELAAAQLQGGELLMRLKKPEEARKSLQKINDQAPRPIRLRARLLEGRSYQDEGRWADAARLYHAALTDGAAFPDAAQVYYNLGLCHHQLKQPKEAIEAWQKCVEKAQGKEAQAAAIVLAKQTLLEPGTTQFSQALEHLSQAVKNISSPQMWNNPLVDQKQAREVFEQAITVFRQAGNIDLALKALEPYSRLATERRLLEWRGQLSAERARALTEQLASGKGDLVTKRDIAQLFSQAADAYGKTAELAELTPKEVGEYLWSAVPCHLSAGENSKAQAKLERLAKMELAPARMGEVWYLLGEEYRTAGRTDEADKAYRECMKYDTRFAYLSRYQIAMAALRAGAMDEAMTILNTNIRLLMSWESEPEALAQSLFAYCNLLYQRKRYHEVVRDLEIALSRHKDRFKDRADLARAQYQLADSYRQIAAQANQNFLLGETRTKESRDHFQQQHRIWLNKAADEFARLHEFLETEEGKECLTPEQRGQVPFIAAKCWFNLGQYTKAVTIYEGLIKKNKGKVQELDALGGAVSCHAAMGQVNHVRQRLLQIREALPNFSEEIREPWQKWLEDAIKGLKGIGDSESESESTP